MTGGKNKLLKLLTDAGIRKATVAACGAVERVKYFDPIFHDRANSSEPIPIGSGQQSDNLLSLAKMIDLMELKKSWRVFEVGTGSGYSTAVLSHLAGEVVTVEYHEELALKARETIKSEGHDSVRFFCGDATDFDEPLGEFDAAIVLAACLRTPYSVINVLKPGGVAVFPLGPSFQQQITRYVNALEAPDISRNFTFFDLCNFDSIRGVYGWIDVPKVPSAEAPAEKPLKEDTEPEKSK